MDKKAIKSRAFWEKVGNSNHSEKNKPTNNCLLCSLSLCELSLEFQALLSMQKNNNNNCSLGFLCLIEFLDAFLTSLWIAYPITFIQSLKKNVC